jgi:hypothetical protein
MNNSPEYITDFVDSSFMFYNFEIEKACI